MKPDCQACGPELGQPHSDTTASAELGNLFTQAHIMVLPPYMSQVELKKKMESKLCERQKLCCSVDKHGKAVQGKHNSEGFLPI